MSVGRSAVGEHMSQKHSESNQVARPAPQAMTFSLTYDDMVDEPEAERVWRSRGHSTFKPTGINHLLALDIRSRYSTYRLQSGADPTDALYRLHSCIVYDVHCWSCVKYSSIDRPAADECHRM